MDLFLTVCTKNEGVATHFALYWSVFYSPRRRFWPRQRHRKSERCLHAPRGNVVTRCAFTIVVTRCAFTIVVTPCAFTILLLYVVGSLVRSTSLPSATVADARTDWRSLHPAAHCMNNEPHNEGTAHCESSLFNNEGSGAHCSNNEPNNEPPARFWEIISPWEMPNCGCTSTVRVNLGSKLTRTVLIFSIVDISRGDIISRNLGSLFPKANALIVEQ